MIRKHLSFRNIKLPKTTAIFNFTSATNCPAKNMCKILDKCYAMKSERIRPHVLLHRNNQSIFWDSVTAEEFAEQFIEMNRRKRIKVKLLRFSESGDFRNQSDVDKAEKIASLLKRENITTYTYTARIDLNFENISHLIINGSSFWKKGIRNTFIPVKEFTNLPERKQCRMNCRICNICITGKKLDIEVKIH